MRMLFALPAAALLLAAAPQAARDWRATVGTAPTGGFTVGNPAARIKLVEYLSFTCSHCAHFAAESKAPLHDAWVRTGQVQVEVRSAARDPFDLAAWTVARCAGPRRFPALSASLFAAQNEWTATGNSWVQANLAAVQAMPQRGQLRAIAINSGIAAIAARHGLTAPALSTCFASDAAMKPVLAMTQAAFAKIPGTPAFEVNGALIAGVNSWAGLEPKLRAAGAK